MTMTDLERRLAEFGAQFDAAWDEILERISHRHTDTSGYGLRPVATGYGGALVVGEINYGHVDVEDVLNHTATPLSAMLTEDGAGAILDRWHDGPTNGDSVYVERWEGPRRRTFHGYVDPVSRRLVQTG